jgi:glyoxylase-like metal-dependent hydrolase (beta-lactamase superfamily II)
MGGFLIRGGGSDRIALVDLGLGDNPMMSARGGAMLDNLRAIGVAPDDVTDILFNHLHLDHVGWASVDGELVFPNATYRCDIADWDHFVTNAAPTESRFLQLQKDLIAPAAERLETWDTTAPSLTASTRSAPPVTPPAAPCSPSPTATNARARRGSHRPARRVLCGRRRGHRS